jgi:hypothetical protein
MKELIITSILLGGMLGWILHLYDKKTRAKKKQEMFDYIEFERARADNPLIKQLHIDQAKRDRSLEESRHILELSGKCTDLVIKYGKELPDEDYEFIMLYEGLTAFLPIAIKPFLQPWDYIYCPGYRKIYKYPREERLTPRI